MGLDMYLTRRVYVGAHYEHRGVEAKISIKVGKRKLNTDPKKINYIEERIGYWRKANSIHSWFVENVQGGEDDCNPHYVSKEQLEELKGLCEKITSSTKLIPEKYGMVIEDSTLAEEYLPTQSGFFFGSTYYDEYYWQDLLDTIEICKNAIEAYDEDSEIYYESSW